MDATNHAPADSSALRIGIILGSTSPGHWGDQLATWVLDIAQRHGGATYERVDLADYHLGNLDEPGTPSLRGIITFSRRWWLLQKSNDSERAL